MTDSPCPFCSPHPQNVFHEGQHVFGLWDQYPVADGHALLITRRHVQTWFDATPEERRELSEATIIAREHILRRFKADGFNVGVNVGAAGGQTVPHLHLHLIPRAEGDVADPRGGVRHLIPSKGNYLAPNPDRLAHGPELPLWPLLREDVDSAVELDIAVAFVMPSGVARLEPQLRDLLGRGGRFRLLTGDYLDVTSPDALRPLVDLVREFGAERVVLRVYETKDAVSFHPKTFIARKVRGGHVAYVGSSNLSRSALEDGVEWNYRIVTSHDAHGFEEVTSAFEALFKHSSVTTLTDEWVNAYERRRRLPSRSTVEQEELPEAPPPPPTPSRIQERALDALQSTRAAGNRAGLVVLATGLGKTWLSAFDACRGEFRKVLFVAHRDEILSQALSTFRRIRPNARLGRYDGNEKSLDADIVFASVLTLGRQLHLDRFRRDAFDYIVMDEFHHASAKTYRRLIDYFQPKFLLGLTATPERTDGGDLLALCGENLVFRCDLVGGIREQLLCPFHYFGVPDLVDYAQIPWRNGRFDPEELTKRVATVARAENSYEQWKKHNVTRTLAFCASQVHADFMAEFFAAKGVRCLAVHSGSKSAPRASSLEALGRGELEVLFAVDMFNEGVDVPEIDSVLMLRPTESPVLFLQQLGRGLRLSKASGKTHLTVVDYVGNHRSFLMKPRTLLGIEARGNQAMSAALERLATGELDLPPGCEVTYELRALDILRGLVASARNADALSYYYDDFLERHGVRPTATEAFHDGYNPRSTRTAHGGWLHFVESKGGLDDAERSALKAGDDFFSEVQVTQMTRSFKMVVAQAMLNLDAWPGSATIQDLTKEVRRLVEASARLRADFGDSLATDSALNSMLQRTPLKAWAEGRGTGNRSYFRIEGDRFVALGDFGGNQRDAGQRLFRELVDWRLAEYLSRESALESASGKFTAKVSHANGRPILFLPDRESTELPSGWTKVEVDGKPLEANFAKIAVNVVRQPGEDQNELPAILRTWFGPNAGMPGTHFLVACEPTDDGYLLHPVKKKEATGLALWAEYSREQIPPLFGAQFSEAIWNSGVINLQNRLILLVTLKKSGHGAEFQYADHFLNPREFQWQSQNRTAQANGLGQTFRHHAERDISVELFVRAEKKRPSGAAAPFVYCGPVRWRRWEGEKPITIWWELENELPKRLQAQFGVR